MANTSDSDSKSEISPEEVFKPTRGDAVHTAIKVSLGTLPVFGGVAAELFGTAIAAPSAKRLEAWLISLHESLKKLEEKFEDFSVEELPSNEVFVSTMIEVYPIVIRARSQAKRERLKNAVLKVALRRSPDENRQTMFFQLCDQLTDSHLDILKLFKGRGVPSINLDDADWRINIALNELANLIEATYPEYEGQFEFYVQVIDDLHREGLITNKIPGKDVLARLHDQPKLSPFAEEFLAFLKSPLDDD